MLKRSFHISCFRATNFQKKQDYQPRALEVRKGFEPAFYQSELDNNGLRVVSQNWQRNQCTVGLWIDIGTRCETDENNGLCKLLERLYFRGTANQDSNQIQKEVLKRGVELKAHTSRETIAIYANCLKKDVEWAVSLLGEIVGAPKYSDEVFNQEKANALKAFEKYENNYRKYTMDYLHASGYQGTPLAKPVYGTKESLENITLDDIYEFNDRFFKSSRMVLAAAGDINHDQLNNYASKYMKDLNCNYDKGIDTNKAVRFIGSEIRDRDDDLALAHVALGFQGPPAFCSDSITLEVSAAINGLWDRTMGGTTNNASHFAAKCFSMPYVNSFENFYIQYHNTSLWGLYYTAYGPEMTQVIDSLLPMFVRTCRKVKDLEVNRAKNQLLTKLMSDMNSSEKICKRLAQDMIWYGRHMPLLERFKRIQITDAAEVKDVMMKYVFDKCPAIGAYGPLDGLDTYPLIRKKTWTYLY